MGPHICSEWFVSFSMPMFNILSWAFDVQARRYQHEFRMLKPVKGFLELGLTVEVSVSAPEAVAEMVVQNHHTWRSMGNSSITVPYALLR